MNILLFEKIAKTKIKTEKKNTILHLEIVIDF